MKRIIPLLLLAIGVLFSARASFVMSVCNKDGDVECGTTETCHAPVNYPDCGVAYVSDYIQTCIWAWDNRPAWEACEDEFQQGYCGGTAHCYVFDGFGCIPVGPGLTNPVWVNHVDTLSPRCPDMSPTMQ